MKTIGLLGGMSWESTAEYYRIANTLVRERLGGVHSARILIDSLDFADVEALQSSGDWQTAGELLATHALALQKAGADLLVLCTNTMHKVARQIESAISIPFVHIADATAGAIHKQNIDTVGLLGTRFTMEQDFYRERITSHGLTVLTPEPAGRETVHNIIYDELVQGIVSEDSRVKYIQIIENLVAAGAQGVILGCTEIELLIGQEDCPVPIFPTARIHIETAVELALTPRERPNVGDLH